MDDPDNKKIYSNKPIQKLNKMKMISPLSKTDKILSKILLLGPVG